MKDNVISIVLVGIGGYGEGYVDELLKKYYEGKLLAKYKGEKIFEVVGAVDPFPEKSKKLDLIKDKGIPIYNTLEEFYAVSRADLAVISSPIQFHREQVCLALEKGSNVLCEKPISATVQDARKMIEAEEKYGKFVAIGFQWSYSDTIQKLKHDINQGLFGKPLRFKTIVLWPRDNKYFERGWAGKKKDSSGNWILDSVASNATAHFLHNMFYVLGDKPDASDYPVSIKAELYRANDIENYDTAAFRIMTEKNVELLFLTTHAVQYREGPIFQYEFENAVITCTQQQDKAGEIIVKFKDGTEKNYGKPDIMMKHLSDVLKSVMKDGKPTKITKENNESVFRYDSEDAVVIYTREKEKPGDMIAKFKDGREINYGKPDNTRKKLWMAIDSIREGKPVLCGLKAAYPQVLTINGAQESMPDIVTIPEKYIKIVDKFDENNATWKTIKYVEGLDDLFKDCYDKWKLPSEMNVPWAKEGREISLKDYTKFEG